MFEIRSFSWLDTASGRTGAAIATAALFAATASGAQPDVEAFDGSFQLETGEILTGGYMVEGGEGRYLYMDTEGLERSAIFEPVSETVFRSLGLVGPEGVELEFFADASGRFDRLEWREPGRDPVEGERLFPHESRTIRFSSADGTLLSGRLLVPRCEGPHPVVVTVHGSGPVNRYGGTFHTFFLKYGVAVLAYDKRGYTPDREAWREPDLATLSEDAAAAVRFAAAQPEIDDERIGIFGSSQAGWVAPRAAVDASETDFMVLRVGPAVIAGKAHLHEVRQELRAKGLSGLDLDSAMDLRWELYSLAMSGASFADADAVVAPYLDEPWYRTAFGEGRVSELWSESWWEWAGRNQSTTPVPHLERFTGPVLWFLAERDENVPLVSSRAALERAFAISPGDDQEIVVLEDVPHSFVTTGSDGRSSYSEGFFDTMADWMNERGYTNQQCWAGEAE